MMMRERIPPPSQFAAGLLDPDTAKRIEQQWVHERDENERQAREELQKMAEPLIGNYKV